MVAISHRHNFIFIKTIKTGGTSVEMYLEPLCTSPEHLVEHYHPTIESKYGIIGRRSAKHPRFFRISRHFEKFYNHMPAQKIRKRLGGEMFDSYLKISSIRNPYDLVISYYHERKKMIGKSTPSDPQERKEDFQDFVAGRWTNQLNLLNVNGQMCVQKFVRLENIQEDLITIVRQIGADPNRLALPHMKQDVKRSRNLTDFYDRKAAERVRSHMAWVFDRFDYPTEIPGL